MSVPSFDHGAKVLMELHKARSVEKVQVETISDITLLFFAFYSTVYGFASLDRYIVFIVLATVVFIWSSISRSVLAYQANSIYQSVIRLDSEFIDYFVQWAHDEKFGRSSLAKIKYNHTLFHLALLAIIILPLVLNLVRQN